MLLVAILIQAASQFLAFFCNFELYDKLLVYPHADSAPKMNDFASESSKIFWECNLHQHLMTVSQLAL